MRFVVQFRAFQPFQALLPEWRTMHRRCHWGDAQRAFGLPGSVGTARQAARFALSPGAAVGTGWEQTKRRTDAAGAIGVLHSVPAPLCRNGVRGSQPESGRVGNIWSCPSWRRSRRRS